MWEYWERCAVPAKQKKTSSIVLDITVYRFNRIVLDIMVYIFNRIVLDIMVYRLSTS